MAEMARMLLSSPLSPQSPESRLPSDSTSLRICSLARMCFAVVLGKTSLTPACKGSSTTASHWERSRAWSEVGGFAKAPRYTPKDLGSGTAAVGVYRRGVSRFKRSIRRATFEGRPESSCRVCVRQCHLLHCAHAVQNICAYPPVVVQLSANQIQDIYTTQDDCRKQAGGQCL